MQSTPVSCLLSVVLLAAFGTPGLAHLAVASAARGAGAKKQALEAAHQEELAQWNELVSRADRTAGAIESGAHRSEELQAAHDVARRVLFQAKVNSLGPICERMCNKVKAYPQCHCPGFGGQPVEEDDARGCMVKFCKPGVHKCPNDDFVLCVKEATDVPALLQWDELTNRFDQATTAIATMAGK